MFVDTRIKKERRAGLLDTTKAMLDTVEREHRSMTVTEKTRFDSSLKEAAQLAVEIDTDERRNDLERIAALRESNGGHLPGDPAPGGRYFRNTEDGRVVRAVSHGESFRTALGLQDTEMSLGRLVYATAIGDWKGAEAEHRAYSQGTSASGGYLLTPEMSASIIDLARAKSVVSAAGAITVPMQTEEMKVALVLKQANSSRLTG
jgi:HK97 family phage major capsid protein